VGSGAVAVRDELGHGDLAAFEPSNEAIEFEAESAAEFVVGSAVWQDHDLVLGYYSVHTSADALREGEARISAIRARLLQEGRLQVAAEVSAVSRPPCLSRAMPLSSMLSSVSVAIP